MLGIYHIKMCADPPVYMKRKTTDILRLFELPSIFDNVEYI